MRRPPPIRNQSLPLDTAVAVTRDTRGVQRTASGRHKLAMMATVFEKEKKAFNSTPDDADHKKEDDRESCLGDDVPKHTARAYLDPSKASPFLIASSPLHVQPGPDVAASRRSRRRFFPILLLLFVLCSTAYFITSFSFKNSFKKGDSVEVLAAQIVQLSQEVRTANERAHQLELEEDEVRSELQRSKTELNELIKVESKEREELMHIGEEVDRYKKSKEEEIERIKKEAGAAAGTNARQGRLRMRQGNEKVEQHLSEQVKKLQSEVQERAKSEVIENFGHGPYRVKINLEFPSDAPKGPPDNENPTWFVIEMAPVDLMPHSVHRFLEQVSAGLWNEECSFYRNAEHIVQASPRSKTTGEEEREQDFINAKLGPVSFQEYSEKFPHEQFTVGFAGRPGGPAFYINKMNNTKTHGPGGQLRHWQNEEGEPCFAKVVEGFDAINRLFNMPIDDQDEERKRHFWMKEFVGISEAELLILKKD